MGQKKKVGFGTTQVVNTNECDGNCIMCKDDECSLNPSYCPPYFGHGHTGDLTTVQTIVKTCKPHEEWVDLAGHKVFLRSSGGFFPHDLQIFIDLADILIKRDIPSHLQQFMPKTSGSSYDIVKWEIIDMRPGSPSLVTFVINILKAGYKVGWGCIGGHGRTGWLAAKVYKTLTGCSGDEAVDYIRDNYCEDAVESKAQLEDLGCKEVLPTKFTKWGL